MHELRIHQMSIVCLAWRSTFLTSDATTLGSALILILGPGPGLTLLIASSMRFAISHKSFLESSVQQQPRHYGSFSFADDNVGRRRSLVAVSQSLRELQRGVALLTEEPPQCNRLNLMPIHGIELV